MRVSAEDRTDRQYRQDLNAAPQALAHMRRITAFHLRLWGYSSLVESVALGLTEMLTNVSRHAGSPVCVLTLQDIGTGVCLTVSDTSTKLPVVRDIDWNAESGRGMRLIASVADLFGSTVTRNGKDVWALCALKTLGCIPGSAGRNSEVYSWVEWLTWSRKTRGTVACQKSGDRVQISGTVHRATRATR